MLTWGLMRPHTEPRTFRRSMGSALREFGYSVVISALRPVAFLLPRRHAGGTGDTPIILVHGYMGGHIDFIGMVKILNHRKVGRIYGFSYPWMLPIERCAALLSRYVDEVRAETKASRVDLVCHSLGGVIALHYVAMGRDQPVRRCVTIASPHAGVAWQGPMPAGSSRQLKSGSSYLTERQDRVLSVPCLSVYSSHDNIVHPGSTASLAKRGGRDLLVRDLGHLEILFNRNVIDEVANFLEAPADADHFAQNTPVNLTKNSL